MKPMEQKQYKDWPKAPEGQHVARLVGIIDVGTQDSIFNGEVKKKPRIYLQFEVYAEDENGKALGDEFGNPFLIGQEFTASMSNKGKLLPFVNTWRGKPLAAEDFPFDFSRMLGKTGLMTVVHNHDKEDEKKIYANISSIVPVPAKMRDGIPEGVAENFFFDLDNADWKAMLKIYDNKLWDAMREKIAKCPEYKARASGGQLPLAKPAGTSDDDIGEIPF